MFVHRMKVSRIFESKIDRKLSLLSERQPRQISRILNTVDSVILFHLNKLYWHVEHLFTKTKNHPTDGEAKVNCHFILLKQMSHSGLESLEWFEC